MIKILEKTENQIISTRAIKPKESWIMWNEELSV